MDADVAITIAFCFEAFLVALEAGLFIGHEIRKSRSEAAGESKRGTSSLKRCAHARGVQLDRRT